MLPYISVPWALVAAGIILMLEFFILTYSQDRASTLLLVGMSLIAGRLGQFAISPSPIGPFLALLVAILVLAAFFGVMAGLAFRGSTPTEN